MTSKSWISNWRYGVPAVAVGVLLGVIWGMAMRGYLGQDMVKVFAGWLCMMFLSGTTAGILWGAAANCGRGGLVIGFAGLVLVCCGIFLLVDWRYSFISFLECAAVILVFVAWVGMWALAAWALRRFSVRVAMGMSLIASMILFAGPMTGVPMVKASSGKVQESVTAVIGYCTPILAVLDAMKGSVQIGGGGSSGWAELPVMYHMTNFGQDVAVPTVRWWLSAAIYATVGLALWGAGMVRRR